MNKIYRLIWNSAQRTWVVAGELSSAKGKGAQALRGGKRIGQMLGAVTAVMLSFPVEAWVAETGTSSTTLDGNVATNTSINGGTASGSDAAVAIGPNSAATQKNSIAMGSSATASGKNSTALGGDTVASGDNAVAIGELAKANGVNAISMGLAAGTSTPVTSQSTIAIGVYAGSSVKGNNDYALGSYAGNNVTGDLNTAYGFSAGSIVEGNGNIAFGTGAGNNVKGHYAPHGTYIDGDDNSYNTAMGYYAGNNVNGWWNNAIGYLAGQNVVGQGNISMGYQAGTDVTGRDNVAIANSGRYVEGNYNTAIGYNSGWHVTGTPREIVSLNGIEASGTFNQAIGSVAGSYVNGTDNFALGSTVGNNVTGSRNVSIGYNTGNDITADDTIAIGTHATAALTHNIALGRDANAAGSMSVAVGGAADATGKHSVVVGTNSQAIGDDASSLGYNTLSLAARALALGSRAVANNIDDVALGAGSVTSKAVATTGATVGNNKYRFAGLSPLSTVSIGSVGQERTLTNLAAGRISSTSTDGINGSQLFASNQAINILDQNAVKYDLNPDDSVNYNSVTLSGDTYYSTTKTGGTRITNVAAGVDGGDAVNVDQLNDVVAGTKTHYYSVNTNGTPRSNYDNDGAVAINSMAVGADATSELQFGTAVGYLAQVKADPTDAGAYGGTAIGHKALAQGRRTVALGYMANAIANGTTALGANAIASGLYGTAIGSDANATGTYSSALGEKTMASGANATAIGSFAVAAGNSSAAFGLYAKSADSAVALGPWANASGFAGTAIGIQAIASETGSVALGSNAETQATVSTSGISIAGDRYNFAGGSAMSSVSVGTTNYGGQYRTITNVAAGRISGSSTDAINGSQLYASNQAIENISSNVNELDNHAVKYDVSPDGTVNYNSVTLGGNTYNSSTKTGGTRITNVAAGVEGGDAVNVDQLNQATTNIYNNGSKYFHANSVKADSVAAGMDSIAVGPLAHAGSTNAVAMGNGAVANNTGDVALGAGSTTTAAVATTGVTIRGTSYIFAGTAPTSMVSIGSEGDERTLTNMAAGRISADSTDGVNGSQLYATNQAIENMTSNISGLDKGSVKYITNNDGTINYNKVSLGGDTYNGTTHTGGTTITNVADGVNESDAVNMSQLNRVNQSVTNIADGKEGMFQVNNTSKLPKPKATGKDAVAGGAGAVASGDNSTAIGAKAKATHSNSVALGNNAVTDRDNSVSMGYAGGERQVTNVAAGTQTTDAVNVGQLKDGVNSANQYTNQKFSDLKNMVNDQKDKLSAGIAGAMAMAGLPQPYQAGASMVGLAGGTYQGESAIALGVSTISDNGKWVTKLSGTTNSKGDTGAAVGVGYQW